MDKTETPEFIASKIIKALHCYKYTQCANCADYIWNCTGKPQYNKPKDETIK